MTRPHLCTWFACLLVLTLGLASYLLAQAPVAEKEQLGAPGIPAVTVPFLVGHRGLLHHAPENTLAGFAACLDLRIGFELDVRRTKDGHLVCLHDDDLRRTTRGQGMVADLSFSTLRKLDAGSWFDPVFAGERVPTLDEVFALVGRRQDAPIVVAIDIKVDDGAVERDVVRLARMHGVLPRLVCIGLAIDQPAVRRRLRAADGRIPVAVLVAQPVDLAKALADQDANWIYIRFLPSAELVARIHGAGKRIFLVGPLVAGHEPDNWRRAREAGVDALLTDYPQSAVSPGARPKGLEHRDSSGVDVPLAPQVSK